jgi:small subunit ribosomal protein S18
MARNSNQKKQAEDKSCYLCANNITEVDYKDVDLLRRYISSNMKIVPRRRSGLSARCQRKVARAIKQARIAGLLPFVGK